jgi:biopolymer transport protein ExbB/TolQ
MAGTLAEQRAEAKRAAARQQDVVILLMLSVHSSYPLRAGEVVIDDRELSRENKVSTRKRGKAKPRETASARKKMVEQERIDVEEDDNTLQIVYTLAPFVNK